MPADKYLKMDLYRSRKLPRQYNEPPQTYNIFHPERTKPLPEPRKANYNPPAQTFHMTNPQNPNIIGKYQEIFSEDSNDEIQTQSFKTTAVADVLSGDGYTHRDNLNLKFTGVKKDFNIKSSWQKGVVGGINAREEERWKATSAMANGGERSACDGPKDRGKKIVMGRSVDPNAPPDLRDHISAITGELTPAGMVLLKKYQEHMEQEAEEAREAALGMEEIPGERVGDWTPSMIETKNKTSLALDLLKVLKGQLKRLGANGTIGLSKLFKRADDNGSNTMDFRKFSVALKSWQIHLTPEDERILFKLFVKFEVGILTFEDFCLVLLDDLPPQRKKFVRRAFSLLDKHQRGYVRAEDLVQMYDASSHPDVVSGSRSNEDVLREFLDVFDVGNGKKDGRVTYQEFENYYAKISALIAGDEFFELMMRNAWHIDGGTGSARNTANRNVLVTNSDGTQSIVKIKNDLGLRRNDDREMLRRLVAQGVDVSHMHEYKSLLTKLESEEEKRILRQELKIPEEMKEEDQQEVNVFEKMGGMIGGQALDKTEQYKSAAQLQAEGIETEKIKKFSVIRGMPPKPSNKKLLRINPFANKSEKQKMSSGEALIFTRLEEELLSRGGSIFITLQRQFRQEDFQNNQKINLSSFKRVIGSLHTSLTENEMRLLYDYFDPQHVGFILYPRFMDAIRGDLTVLSERRKSLVLRVFSHLSPLGNEQIEANLVAQEFDPLEHPDVLLRKKSPEDVLKDFLSNFDVGEKIEGIVTKNEFLSFYMNIGACIESDDYFELLLSNTWHLSNTSHPPSSSSNPPSSSSNSSSRGKNMIEEDKKYRRLYVQRGNGQDGIINVTDRNQSTDFDWISYLKESRRIYDVMIAIPFWIDRNPSPPSLPFHPPPRVPAFSGPSLTSSQSFSIHSSRSNHNHTSRPPLNYQEIEGMKRQAMTLYMQDKFQESQQILTSLIEEVSRNFPSTGSTSARTSSSSSSPTPSKEIILQQLHERLQFVIQKKESVEQKNFLDLTKKGWTRAMIEEKKKDQENAQKYLAPKYKAAQNVETFSALLNKTQERIANPHLITPRRPRDGDPEEDDDPDAEIRAQKKDPTDRFYEDSTSTSGSLLNSSRILSQSPSSSSTSSVMSLEDITFQRRKAMTLFSQTEYHQSEAILSRLIKEVSKNHPRNTKLLAEIQQQHEFVYGKKQAVDQKDQLDLTKRGWSENILKEKLRAQRRLATEYGKFDKKENWVSDKDPSQQKTLLEMQKRGWTDPLLKQLQEDEEHQQALKDRYTSHDNQVKETFGQYELVDLTRRGWPDELLHEKRDFEGLMNQQYKQFAKYDTYKSRDPKVDYEYDWYGRTIGLKGQPSMMRGSGFDMTGESQHGSMGLGDFPSHSLDPNDPDENQIDGQISHSDRSLHSLMMKKTQATRGSFNPDQDPISTPSSSRRPSTPSLTHSISSERRGSGSGTRIGSNSSGNLGLEGLSIAGNSISSQNYYSGGGGGGRGSSSTRSRPKSAYR